MIKCQGENLLADDETWKIILESNLCKDSAAIEILARLLFTIGRAIESGPEGAIQASNTLRNGIELIPSYQRSQSCAQAVRTFIRRQIEAAGRAA